MQKARKNMELGKFMERTERTGILGVKVSQGDRKSVV